MNRLPVTEQPRCHAYDVDCDWEHCPQIRDGEPRKSGRHCPLDVFDPEDEGKAGER